MDLRMAVGTERDRLLPSECSWNDVVVVICTGATFNAHSSRESVLLW